MTNVIAAVSSIRGSVQGWLTMMSAALMSLFMTPQRVRSTRALSFLEYAILAAVIVGVGVALAVFFGGTIEGLQDNVGTDLTGGNNYIN